MKNLVILYIMAFAYFFTATIPSSAQELGDVIYLKDGSKIIGIIIEQIPNESIKIQLRDGSEMVYTFDKIARMTREPLNVGLRDLKEASYAEIGANIGIPSVLNIAYGHWFGPVGLRMSGLYLGRDAQGVQFNLGFKLSDNPKRSHSLAAVAGTSVMDGSEWDYAGIVYNLNIRGFFLEAGLTAGSGDYASPQATLQLGYMHRFLPKP
jgi:hypothetical protein